MNNLKKETNDSAIKGIRNLFRLKKENKAIKGRIIRDIRDIRIISSGDDNDEELVMISSSDSIEIMSNDEGDEVIEELFKSLQNRY